MFGALKKRLAEFIGRSEEVAQSVPDEGVVQEEEKQPPEASTHSTEKKDETAPHKVEATQKVAAAGKKDSAIHHPTKREPIKALPEVVVEEETVEAEVTVSRAAVEAQKKEKASAAPRLSAVSKVKSLFTRKVRLSEGEVEDLIWQLQLDLLQSDIAVETADYITGEIKNRLLSTDLPSDDVAASVRETLKEVLLTTLTPDKPINLLSEINAANKPYKILFIGVNGTGKTTTMAKVARHLMNHKLKVVFAAGDTFRAGAIEQLKEHADRVGAPVVAHKKGSDAAAVIYDAIEHAKARQIDVVLADSAGRIQTNINLMDELKKIVRVNKPDLKIFIGDALTGNDAVQQAREFHQAVGIDAVILTKMDADANGGCAISIAHETKKPIIYVGVGQTYDDLKPFDPRWFVEQLV
ncbi:Signal recognition particle receptor FtsY [uncultured archaeon]|nr:Signal recognition particle receptor FtsY [uncultured archaeon]